MKKKQVPKEHVRYPFSNRDKHSLSCSYFNALSVCLSDSPSVCPSVIQFACLSLCLCVCLSVYLSICLLSVILFVCMSICLSVCVSVCLSVNQFVFLFVYLSGCLGLYICLSDWLSERLTLDQLVDWSEKFPKQYVRMLAFWSAKKFTNVIGRHLLLGLTFWAIYQTRVLPHFKTKRRKYETWRSFWRTSVEVFGNVRGETLSCMLDINFQWNYMETKTTEKTIRRSKMGKTIIRE